MAAGNTRVFWSRGPIAWGLAAVLCSVACRRATGDSAGPNLIGQREYTATVLGFGFKPPKNTPPSIEILGDDAAYRNAAQRDAFANRFDDQQVPMVDFSRDVVVVLERADEGGADVRPVVRSVVRKRNVLRFETGYQLLPDAQGLDVQLRPYLYFTLAREAVDGAPQIELVVDGGFVFIEVPDLDEGLRWAARHR